MTDVEVSAVESANLVLYTGKVAASGRMSGRLQSSDAVLDMAWSAPGTGAGGTNPEQLLAAGWSSCFALSITHTAAGMGVALTDDVLVRAEVDLCNTAGTYEGDFFVRARLEVQVPGVDESTARAVVDAAHRTCPYSLATKGNVETTITVV